MRRLMVTAFVRAINQVSLDNLNYVRMYGCPNKAHTIVDMSTTAVKDVNLTYIPTPGPDRLRRTTSFTRFVAS